MVDEADAVRELGARVSNWGRWGPDDERGTLNHITPEKLVAAARLVRAGKVFSLAIPIDEHGPNTVHGSSRGELRHTMTAGTPALRPRVMEPGVEYSDDTLFMHLQATTQWDALAHIIYDGHLYNGYAKETITDAGASRAGIDKTCSAYVSRGVVLDVARAQGVECLPPTTHITAEVLQEVAARQQVRVEGGDILLVRTGMMGVARRTGSWQHYFREQPGLHWSVASWLADQQIAAVAADNFAVEHLRFDPVANPLHMVAIRDMGMCFGELWDLEGLADDCVADGVYECLLVAPALPITGGVGSPVNPIAVK